VLILIDAPRCPYCARVRIALPEKNVPSATVVVDLADRPVWLYRKNPAGAAARLLVSRHDDLFGRLAERPSFAAELDVVAALA
jgi:Glutathione S-transferase, N-terminal domain